MAKGDFNVRVKEAPLSPINNLIVSFNSMVAELELSRNKLLQAEKEMMWREMAMPSANFIHYNLNDQIKEIVTPYESKVNIQLDLDESLPKFYGDKMQMKQVFVNLIQNAIQSIKGSDGAISIITKYKSLKFIITIEDNGEGIQDEDLDKIFRPYFTKREKGTGLGLAIVKRIVSQHNGRIEVTSKKSKGTKFTIIIHLETSRSASNDSFL